MSLFFNRKYRNAIIKVDNMHGKCAEYCTDTSDSDAVIESICTAEHILWVIGDIL